MKNINLESYVGDKIDRISYWYDNDLLDIITEYKELHYNIRAIEIDFISGKKLTVDCMSRARGLDFGNKSLNIDEWDDDAVKVDMSQHSLLNQLVGKEITDIQVWWCDNLWTCNGKISGPKSYKQDLTILTEDNGYFLCSSAEVEEATPSISLFDSDEIIIVTDKRTSKKLELEKYGKEMFIRYKRKKV